MRSVLLGAVLTACALGPAARADEAKNLAGLRVLALSIGPQSEASNKCGFTQQWLEGRTRRVLESAKVAVADIDNLPHGLLEVSTTTLPGQCSASVSVEVSTYVRSELTGRKMMATVWRAGGVGGDLAIRQNFDGLVQRFADDWSSANR